MGSIVLIETADIAARYAAEAVRGLGHEPVYFALPDHYQGDTRTQLADCRYHPCDTTSVEAVIAGIHKHCSGQVVGVLTTQDERLRVASEVAIQLGTRGIDPAVRELKDKAAVVRLIPEYSPPSVSFQLPEIPVAALQKLFERGRIILKPTQGAGAVGAITLDDPSELDNLRERLEAQKVPAHMGAGEWLAQAFIPGQLVSLEGYVHHSKVHALGFSGRKKVGYTESAAIHPVDASLPPGTTDKAREAMRALVQRSGFVHGYFHVEFIVAEKTCILIDANMGRIGGGAIAEQLALSHGIHPVAVYRHLLGITMEDDSISSPYLTRDRRQTYAIFYGLQHGGVVQSVEVPQDSSCHHTLIIDPGTRVSPMGTNDFAWVGILSGFTRDCDRVIKQIRIKTPEGDQPAYF